MTPNTVVTPEWISQFIQYQNNTEQASMGVYFNISDDDYNELLKGVDAAKLVVRSTWNKEQQLMNIVLPYLFDSIIKSFTAATGRGFTVAHMLAAVQVMAIEIEGAKHIQAQQRVQMAQPRQQPKKRKGKKKPSIIKPTQ